MAVPFDHIAPAFDSVFAQSAVGQLQRKQVWQYVEKIIPELKGYEMLELNHGSGEDAVLFGCAQRCARSSIDCPGGIVDV